MRISKLPIVVTPSIFLHTLMMSDFRFPPRRRWDMLLLRIYAANNDNSLLTFRDNLSVLSSRVKNPNRPLEMGPIGCPETSVKNTIKQWVIFQKSSDLSRRLACHKLIHEAVWCISKCKLYNQYIYWSLSYTNTTGWGARGGAVDWGTALQAGRSRVPFPVVSLEFFIDIILSATLWFCSRLSL